MPAPHDAVCIADWHCIKPTKKASGDQRHRNISTGLAEVVTVRLPANADVAASFEETAPR